MTDPIPIGCIIMSDGAAPDIGVENMIAGNIQEIMDHGQPWIRSMPDTRRFAASKTEPSTAGDTEDMEEIFHIKEMER